MLLKEFIGFSLHQLSAQKCTERLRVVERILLRGDKHDCWKD